VLLLVGSGDLPEPLPANVRVLPSSTIAGILPPCSRAATRSFTPATSRRTALAVLEAMAKRAAGGRRSRCGRRGDSAQGGGVLVAPRSAEALAAGVAELFQGDRRDRRQCGAADRRALCVAAAAGAMLARYRRVAAA